MKELIRKILNEEDRRKNKTQQFQKLIDDEIESMKGICKQMSADDEEIISFDACDFLDLDPKVVVTDVDKFYGKLRILVIIKYEAAMHFHDEELFIYELQSRLKWVGNVMIDVEDVITTYPNKLNETFTGDTPTDITKQFTNKPVKLIGDVNTTTKIQNINVNNDGSVNISFQNGMKVNSSLPMLRRFNLEVDIPLEFKIKKKGNINESEETNPGKYARTIKELVKTYEDEDFVCDIDVEYYGAADAYIIIVRVDKKEMETYYEKETIWYATERIRDYLGDLYKNIYREVKTYFPVEVAVHISQTKCSKKLNESEEKKSRLLSNIEENGLYEVISSTGLHINEIEQRVGQLSREVLERFIKDVVKEHFQVIDDDGKTYIIYLEDYPFDVVPIGNSDYVDQLRVTNNKLFILVTLYEEDEYGDLEEQSYEIVSPKNLSYTNIYEIAGQLAYLMVKDQI